MLFTITNGDSNKQLKYHKVFFNDIDHYGFFSDKRAGTGGTLIHVTALQTARVLNSSS